MFASFFDDSGRSAPRPAARPVRNPPQPGLLFLILLLVVFSVDTITGSPSIFVVVGRSVDTP